MTRRFMVWMSIGLNLILVSSTFGGGSVCPIASIGDFGGRYYYHCRTGLAGNACAGDIVTGSDTRAHSTGCKPDNSCTDAIGGGGEIADREIHKNSTGFSGCDLRTPTLHPETVIHADFTCYVKHGTQAPRIVRVLVVTRNGVTSGTTPTNPTAFLVPVALCQEVRTGETARPINTPETAFPATESGYDKNVWNFSIGISDIYNSWNPSSNSIYKRGFDPTGKDPATAIPVVAIVVNRN